MGFEHMTRRLPVCSDDDGMHVKLPAEAETLRDILNTLIRIEERLSAGVACGLRPAPPCEHSWEPLPQGFPWVSGKEFCRKCGDAR